MMSQARQSDVLYGPEGILWGEVLRAAMLADGIVPLITAPDRDPVEAYPSPDELDPKEFQIPPTGLSDEQRNSALGKLEKYLFRKRDHMLGYQANEDMNGYRQDLSRFMECHINNIGDPFKSGNFKPNSKVVERAVLDYFAALWNAKWPHDPDTPDFAERYWGYALTMGSTEGNMYALWNARDYLQDRAETPDYPWPEAMTSTEGTERIADFWRRRWLRQRLAFAPVGRRLEPERRRIGGQAPAQPPAARFPAQCG